MGADNTVDCSLGSVAPGDTVTVTVTATLDADYTGTLSNTATASPTPDPEPDNNTDTVSSRPARPPTCPWSRRSARRRRWPAAGDLHPHRPQRRALDRPRVTVTDPLDEVLLDPTATTTVGSCAPIAADGELTCSLGSLPSGGTATITVTATVAGGATGALTNTASVSSSALDPNGATTPTP